MKFMGVGRGRVYVLKYRETVAHKVGKSIEGQPHLAT